MRPMTDDLPRDPDLDDLPAELAEHHGPLTIRARDPETGETFEASPRTSSRMSLTAASTWPISRVSGLSLA
jgi:hypothetical protein